jgi:hypothetical protein
MRAFRLLLAVALLCAASSVFAECCECTGCPPDGRTLCADGGFCDELDGLLCFLGCDSQGCSGSNLSESNCIAVSSCPLAIAAAPTLSPQLQMVLALIISLVGVYALRRRVSTATARFVIGGVTALAGVAAVHAAIALNVAGTWTQQGGSQTGSPGWSIQLNVEDDGSLSGPVTITGSSGLQAGMFHGQASGNQITGNITDAQGDVVVTLTGAAAGNVFTGTYQTPGGTSGTFSTQIN